MAMPSHESATTTGKLPGRTRTLDSFDLWKELRGITVGHSVICHIHSGKIGARKRRHSSSRGASPDLETAPRCLSYFAQGECEQNAASLLPCSTGRGVA